MLGKVDRDGEEKQKKLNGEEEPIEEEEEDELDPFDEWLEETNERLEKVEDYFGTNRKDLELIKERAIRPYHYFKEDREGSSPSESLTDKQENYLLTGLIPDARRRFFKYVNNVESIEAVGQPDDIVPNLTKEQASDLIEYLKGERELPNKEEEGGD